MVCCNVVERGLGVKMNNDGNQQCLDAGAPSEPADPRTCKCGHTEPKRRPKWCPRCGKRWQPGERTAWDAVEDLVDGIGRWFSDALARPDRESRRMAALCVVFIGLAAALAVLGTVVVVVVTAFV